MNLSEKETDLKSLTSPVAPFPLNLPLPVVHQHFLNTLITKSCFLVWTLSTRPPSTFPIMLRLAVSRFIQSTPARGSVFLHTPYLSLYHCLHLLRSGCLCNVTGLIVGPLSSAAVYKVFRASAGANVYLPELLTTQKRALGRCRGVFHTDNAP